MGQKRTATEQPRSRSVAVALHLELQLQGPLQTAIVRQRRADLPGGRAADICIREAEKRRVEEVVRFKAELEAQFLR